MKKAVVGRGRATKAQVGFMVQQLLRLQRPPRPADAADGVAIALAYFLLPHGADVAGVRGTLAARASDRVAVVRMPSRPRSYKSRFLSEAAIVAALPV